MIDLTSRALVIDNKIKYSIKPDTAAIRVLRELLFVAKKDTL
jgi:hypothetical protein